MLRLKTARIALPVIVGLLCAKPVTAEIYKTTLVRAAPGELLNLVEFYKSHFEALEAAGDTRPLWMRHSQGDQWDLLILFPIGDFAAYYGPQKTVARKEAFKRQGLGSEAMGDRWQRLVARHEDVFVDGPPVKAVQEAFKSAGFFHVEMFRALPGRYLDLLDQRRRENIYLEKLSRPQNLVFTHIEGAAWDCFTIGFYRDLKHFAASADIPEDREDDAAKAAGFESASAIGPFLRTLIAEHHDTLAVSIR